MNSYFWTKARTTLRLLFVLVLVMGALPWLPGGNPVAQASSFQLPAIYLNEIQVTTVGIDWEFFEIQGPSGTSLTGYWLIELEGDVSSGKMGHVDAALDLSGQTIPADGFWLGISPAGATEYGVTGDMSFPNNTFENSTATYLLVQNFTGAIDDDLDTDDDGVLDVTPWTAILDSVGLRDADAGDLVYSPVDIGPDGTNLPSGTYRCPDAPAGTFSNANIHNFSVADGTPGAANACGSSGPTDPCTVTSFTPIYDIQGSGAVSPLVTAGTTEDVVTRGIVTADFQDDQRNGFFIQDATGDGDFNTSDGIFVYEDGFSVPVAVGDVVGIIGDVSEYFGNTQISTYTSDADHVIQVCGTGSIGSTTVNLPIPDTYATPEDFWEPLEGMYITIPQTLTATDVYELGRYGRVMLSTGGRLENFTQVNSPNAAAYQDHLDNLFRRVVNLDDRSDWQNPPVVIHPDPQLSPTNVLRDGATVSGLTGVVNYTRSAYRIDPVGAVPFNTAANPRPAARPAVGGTVQVASFNLLNFFVTIDTGQAICGPTGGLNCRGADTLDEYNRQLAKTVAALAALDADVVGLAEIENHATDDALTTLVNELNAAAGAGTYAAINTGPIGTDAIKVAMIYKPGVVTPVGAFALLDYTGDAVQNYRPSLLQTFEENASGEVFSVVMNHFKSKGCTDAVSLDLDQGDGQSCYNFTRTAGAAQLAAWLATDPTSSGDPDFLIIGDLNSYAQEDPIAQLGADGFDDLLERFVGYTDSAYTYVYFGEWGTLDYTFASPTLSGQVTGAAEWHINADETPAFDYNNYNQADLYVANQFRSSDHDPILIGLNLVTAVDGGTGGAAAGAVGPDGLPITSLPSTGYASQPEAQSSAVTPWLFVALAAVIVFGLTLGGWVLRRTSR